MVLNQYAMKLGTFVAIFLIGTSSNAGKDATTSGFATHASCHCMKGETAVNVPEAKSISGSYDNIGDFRNSPGDGQDAAKCIRKELVQKCAALSNTERECRIQELSARSMGMEPEPDCSPDAQNKRLNRINKRKKADLQNTSLSTQ